MILEKTVELINRIYKNHEILPPKISRVVIGIGFSGVEIAAYSYSPILGLARTFPSVINEPSCSKIDFAGKLTEKSHVELMQWSIGPLSLKKIIGIATLNAVSQHVLKIMNPYKKIKEDLIDYLNIDGGTRVTFVGAIKPMIQNVSKRTNEITIIDNNLLEPQSFKNYTIKNHINELKEEELSTDILFCTGSALINNTLEEILALFKRKARYFVVIGPSASLIPEILFQYGVDMVGGMKIMDSDATIRVLQEGGGMKYFKQYGKKYNIINEKN